MFFSEKQRRLALVPVCNGFALLGAAILATAAYWYLSKSARRLRLPPGPKPRLLFGNLYQLPSTEPWLTYADWAKAFGPIVYFQTLQRQVVVLNSLKAASDLLDARSHIYSDRPVIWMAGELAGRKKTVFHTRFLDPRFKLFRKLLNAGLNARTSRNYRPIQIEEKNVLLKALATNPEDFVGHVRRNAAAVILKIAYGYHVDGNDDLLVKVIDEGFKLTGSILTPGKYLIESFPALRFVPEWFPGAGFKRVAKHAREQLSRIEQVPLNWARANIATGDYVESFISEYLYPESGELPSEEEQDIIKWSSAVLYAGGADTTVSIMTTFFLIMALYPEVQKRAQAEIEQVTAGRLPTLDNYDSLPYVIALVKEIMRWGPSLALSLPHMVMEDDIYEGYVIPKGTTIYGNIWAIGHDESVYPNPMTFDPSRYIGENPQPDPYKFVFGFGRRICPGAHLAEMSIFLNIANILATFNISKAVDENGKEVEPTVAWTTGPTTHLKPFSCQITPRFDVLAALSQ